MKHIARAIAFAALLVLAVWAHVHGERNLALGAGLLAFILLLELIF